MKENKWTELTMHMSWGVTEVMFSRKCALFEVIDAWGILFDTLRE